MKPIGIGLLLCTITLSAPGAAVADPCGMVPPIYSGPGKPIERVGIQKTYVFHRNGVETIAIRPGFRGKVDEFGMLIPFPTPPALRKLPDNFFSHIANAAEPPEVVVYVNQMPMPSAAPMAGAGGSSSRGALSVLAKQEVRVLRKEAVGMYEVAVLAAGSAQALKRWMDNHRYRYPKGMDTPVNDYVQAGWCFVAVRTRVGSKSDANPRPGRRSARPKFPAGGGFSGAVQAMGFRFRTKQLVVPMRLSAFNGGRMRNVVYVLSDSPKRLDRIPEKYVVRQIRGSELYKNMTKPLPLRVIGGDVQDIKSWQKRNLKRRRNPERSMKYAWQIFGGDLLAANKSRLSHPHEEQTKELLNVSEALNLRGPQIDRALEKLALSRTERMLKSALRGVRQMTLTVVDGDFARSIVANHNLTASNYRMPASRNNAKNYDPKHFGPRSRPRGKRYHGSLLPAPNHAPTPRDFTWTKLGAAAALALLLLLKRGHAPRR